MWKYTVDAGERRKFVSSSFELLVAGGGPAGDSRKVAGAPFLASSSRGAPIQRASIRPRLHCLPPLLCPRLAGPRPPRPAIQ